MQLLVSVRSADEAASALIGGADLIDAKEPLAGSLGAVSIEMLRAIVAAVARRRPVTAALGEGADEAAVERDAAAFTAAGAMLVKIGFAGIATRDRVAALVEAAARGAGRQRLIAVAYADHARAGSVAPEDVIAIAGRARIAGVLVDTADKAAPRLTALAAPASLSRWVSSAHSAGLLAAMAGKLTPADLPLLQRAGADIAGVRSAACDDGRLGRVAADRVSSLRRQCVAPAAPAPPAPDLPVQQ